jgi:hypothetical protein
MMDERLKKVLEQKKAGKPIMKSLKEIGLEQCTYYRLCHEAGIPIRKNNLKRKRTYTMDVVEKVKERIETGELLKDICATMGLDPRNLSRYCRINGVKLYNEKTFKLNYLNRVRPARHKDSKRPELIALLKDGSLSTTEIAKKMKVTTHYVSALRTELKKSEQNS